MSAGDIAWVLGSAALVLFMTPGLALFYGGMDRTRNVGNMLAMNFWCLLVIPVLWATVGYSLAQSGDGRLIGNLDLALLKGMTITGEDGGAGLLAVAFLGMFAVITPALISGAVAGRMRFTAWMAFSVAWFLLVYVPVFKWVYGGWIGELGALDFAGGTAIHVNAGIAALAAVIALGKRKGWPEESPAPHSMPLVMLGAGILWFGWFGFNAGSAFAANGQAIQAFVNTFLAAAAAGLAWVLIEKAKTGHVTNLGAASGIVAGLVAITPAAGFVAGMSPIVIGAVAAVACYFGVSVKPKLGYDDAMDVVGIHFVAGLVGSLLVGLFADPVFFGGDFLAGLFLGGGTRLFMAQLVGNLGTIAYCFIVTTVIVRVIDRVIGARVTEEAEANGLDLFEHGESAYSPEEAEAIVPALSGAATS
ncbi:MAG: ammonium transporter [Actinomycetes bacterium]|jgi:Amt family ammonium transporter|nr:MAG: ammonia channel protein [Actinomycetota bacterium]